MSTIILIRHAQASSGGKDIDRDLTSAGIKQARNLGLQLKEYFPDISFFTSPALRAKQTMNEIIAANSLKLEFNESVVVIDELYYGGLDDIHNVIFSLKTADALVVGHEPNISALAYAILASGVKHVLSHGVSTATAIVLSSPKPCLNQWTKEDTSVTLRQMISLLP